MPMLCDIAPEIFGITSSIRAHEALMVIKTLVREARFGEAVWFLEKNSNLITDEIHNGNPEPVERQLHGLKQSAKSHQQERSSLTSYQVDLLLKRHRK